MKKIYLLLLCALCSLGASYASSPAPIPNTDPYVLLDSKLFLYNTASDSLEFITAFDALPADGLLTSLTYHTEDSAFYSILDFNFAPKLVRLGVDGSYSLIGSFTDNGVPITVSEGIAYNAQDGKLYVSVSLDGSDVDSESIAEINTQTAALTPARSYTNDYSARSDGDRICFGGDSLYIYDLYNGSYRSFSALNFTSGETHASGLFSSGSGQGGLMTGMDYADGKLHYFLGREYAQLNVATGQETKIAAVWSDPALDADRIKGFAFGPEKPSSEDPVEPDPETPVMPSQYLFTLLDKTLFMADSTLDSLVYVTDYPDLPAGADIRTLTYHPGHGCFYTIQDFNTAPKLVRLSINGLYTLGGQLHIQGNAIAVSEGLAYNNNDGKLYASASLDGPNTTSETLVEVNTETGELSYISPLSTPYNSGGDGDRIGFGGDSLFIYDLVTGDIRTLSVMNFNDSLPNASGLFQSTPNQGGIMTDMDSENGIVYYFLNRNLMQFNPATGNELLVRTMDSPPAYDGIRILGVAFAREMPAPKKSEQPVLPGESIYTLIGNDLYKVDTLSKALELVAEYPQVPEGGILTSLTFHEEHKLFYTLLDFNTAPKLVSLNATGTYKELNHLHMGEQVITLAEGLAYNANDGLLYAAASLDGGLADGDIYSETLVSIDIATGNVTPIMPLASTLTNVPEADRMCFDGDSLYIYDLLSGGVRSFSALNFGQDSIANGFFFSGRQQGGIMSGVDAQDGILYYLLGYRLMQLNPATGQELLLDSLTPPVGLEDSIPNGVALAPEHLVTALAQPHAAATMLKAYPNPARRHITLQLPQEGYYTLSVVDANGRVHLNVPPQWMGGTAGIDLAGYPAGLYMVMLRQQDGTLYHTRFIKQ